MKAHRNKERMSGANDCLPLDDLEVRSRFLFQGNKVCYIQNRVFERINQGLGVSGAASDRLCGVIRERDSF